MLGLRVRQFVRGLQSVPGFESGRGRGREGGVQARIDSGCQEGDNAQCEPDPVPGHHDLPAFGPEATEKANGSSVVGGSMRRPVDREPALGSSRKSAMEGEGKSTALRLFPDASCTGRTSKSHLIKMSWIRDVIRSILRTGSDF